MKYLMITMSVLLALALQVGGAVALTLQTHMHAVSQALSLALHPLG